MTDGDDIDNDIIDNVNDNDDNDDNTDDTVSLSFLSHRTGAYSHRPSALPDLTQPRRSHSIQARHFQKLTVNAVRVYSVDSALTHDDCMSQLNAAGIYATFVSGLFHLRLSTFF